jgi:hypothetical protein
MNETIHPARFKLDALAAGDADAATEAHLASCETCRAHVDTLAAEVAAFRQAPAAAEEARAFAERVVARTTERPKVVVLAAYLAPVLLAAAALFLVLHRPAPELPEAQHDPAPSESDLRGDTHFKGSLAVTAIRDRAGVQERFTGPFTVRPDDRLRVEVAVDHPMLLSIGLLFDDGSWTPLLTPVDLATGTHLSDLAARFDSTPTDAELLVGSPEEVTRARATHRFEGILAWRIDSSSKARDD